MASFWNTAAIEPNRQFRWYIEFATTLTAARYALKKAAKPTVKIGEVKHKYLNHEFFYPGRIEWEPITVSFASVKTDKGLLDALLINALKGSGYIYPTAPTAVGNAPSQVSSISKSKAVSQITAGGNGSNLKLVQINADGKDIESWYLFNPFFTDVKYDTLEYATEEILNIDCTIKYDWASLGDISGKIL